MTAAHLKWARRSWRVAAGSAALLLLVIGGTIALSLHLWASIPYRGYGASTALVEIPAGAHIRQTLAILEDRGIVRRFPLALVYLRLTRRAEGIKTGEYAFARPMTPREVFDKIIRGDVHHHRVTILEGSRAAEVFEAFVRAGFGPVEEFVEAFRDTTPIRGLDDEAVDLEGYLFPDTYSLAKGTTPRAIVALMVARFKEVFGPEGIAAARARDLTVRQVVTLASLVERETARPDEDRLVASVFTNRLRRGMRLQCDPTVIYAMAMRNLYDGNIRKRDLSIDSLYNTYLYAGLTPGPIGSPSASALRAAVEPAETEYLYFVSMNTGRHYFSRTLDEHNRAVWEYQKKPYRLRQLARSKRAQRGN